MDSRFITCRMAATFTMLLVAQSGMAQGFDARYWVRTGVYFAQVDSTLQVSGSAGNIGSEIDFEKDLDLDEHRVLPSFSGRASLGGGWNINGDIYTLKRTGTRSISRELVVDDVVYPVGASVTSGFRSTTFRLAAGYGLVRGADHEIGASLGLHLTDFSAFIEGVGNVGMAEASLQRRKRDLLAPLPTVGLYGRFEPARNVRLAARVDYLKLRVSDYTGSLVNAEGGASVRVHRNIGIGAMYRHVNYRLDVKKERWNGGISYRFSGPLLFVEAGF